jgi:hypothetical protein
MKKEKRSSFRGKVISSAAKTKNAGSAYGYLNLPKGVKVFNIPEGVKTVALDFLPYEVKDPKHPESDPTSDVAQPGSLWYRRPFKIHRNVGSTNDAVVCLTSIGKKCPICEYQNKRFKEGAEKEELTALRAKSRSLYVVVPLDSKKHEEVPHIWDMADSLFQDTLIEELQENEENEDFFALEGGATAEVRVRWESLGGHSYPEARSISFEARDDYEESILEEVPCLDEVLKVLPYDELSAKFFDLPEEGEGPLNPITDEERPARRKRHTEPEPEEEKEEEEEKPKRISRTAPHEATHAARKPKVEEKEEEPEEEEKPAATMKRKSSASPSTKKDKCPFGHRFGVDTEDFDECDTCEIWADCLDEKEKK